MNKREQIVTEEQFKKLVQHKKIRPASLEDVSGTHHKRPLYRHPRTKQWYVKILN